MRPSLVLTSKLVNCVSKARRPHYHYFPNLHSALSNLRTLFTMPTQHFDALVLGSGQSGTPLASHLKSLGQSTCLVERAHIAGCCVNEGCTPTKTMVASGRVAYLARRAGEYGIHSGNGEVRVDMKRVRERKRDIVTSFRGGSEKRLEGAGVRVIMGEARFTSEKEVLVTSNSGDGKEQIVSADSIYINVGCRPSRPQLPGLEDVEQERVLDSTSIQELGDVPEHLVVIGGGFIGLEFGQLFRRLGAKVTVVHRGPRLGGREEDPELVDCLADILREDGVEILFNVSGTKLEKTSDEKLPIRIAVETGTKGALDIHASHILLATGRVPNTDTLGLDKAGIKTTPSGHIVASPTLETNVPGVFVLGDVKGGPAFTHVSYDDFRIVRDNLTLNSSKTEGAVKTTEQRAPFIPSVVYTDPQFAHIGPKLGALPKGKKYITYSMPGSWIARGLETDETRGMLKVVIDSDTDKIVSFSAISVEGGELMAVVQMAMVGGLKWQVLRDAVWAHPSWSESLNNLWGGERKEITVS
ncbi:hypothetical protein BDV96DRAFT_587110 [Lophiotrema nucula]|uniref:FAD/NAD(P)-binding domain-containing protein n=1 Tax=Lophiotrema nucula TaxID=690887 RepID=A0A6A5YRJ8_9PLEO|nr:hypothetical protein BDV96DRAFT_587110 [Lophiotrema nucula]